MHLSLDILHDGLSLANVTRPGNVGALVHGVVREHLVVAVTLQLLALSADLLRLCDDSEALCAIKSRVDDLSLEGEASHLGHVDFFHL